MSLFITKPPAARMTALARITPVSANLRHCTPTTSPVPVEPSVVVEPVETTSALAPVS